MQLRTKIEPGDIGYLVHLHGKLYSAEYNLDPTFEAYVAVGLGEFVKSFDERKDRLWIAEDTGRVVGSIAIAGLPQRKAQLRWFLVHPDARGQGLGRRLINEALQFCRDHDFESVFLWTISELKVAAHLYKQAGFALREQKTHSIWGDVHTEEKYDMRLD
jgi:N-acetylglutamate synthase-like GNAT family acetyltransferase